MVEVGPPFLVQTDEQRFFGGADRFDRLFVLNGAFAKDGGLGRPFSLLIVMLQRQEQRKVGVAVKGALIGGGGDGAVAGDEPVIGPIQLLAGFQNPFLTRARELCAQTLSHGVADPNQPVNPAAPLRWHVRQLAHHVAVANAEVTVDEGVSVGLYVTGRGDRLLRQWRGDGLPLRFVNAAGQPFDRRRQGLA